MKIKIKDLFEAPEYLPIIAKWNVAEFWSDHPTMSEEKMAGLYALAETNNKIPITLIALADGQLAGTASIVENDDDKRTHLRPWLAAVLVHQTLRNQGIGSKLVNATLERAARLNIEQLYLGTDSPEFYTKLGAVVHEQVADEFCIMRFDIT